MPLPPRPTSTTTQLTNSFYPHHPRPLKQLMDRHRQFLADRDVRGRIWLSPQGINCQAGGTLADGSAYAQWAAAQPEFQGLRYSIWPASEHMFPKLRLKLKPNLISLAGGMQSMPITGARAAARAGARPRGRGGGGPWVPPKLHLTLHFSLVSLAGGMYVHAGHGCAHTGQCHQPACWLAVLGGAPSGRPVCSPQRADGALSAAASSMCDAARDPGSFTPPLT